MNDSQRPANESQEIAGNEPSHADPVEFDDEFGVAATQAIGGLAGDAESGGLPDDAEAGGP